jgi:cytosine/adenosine deaminase-related metal-dependent hydrolase
MRYVTATQIFDGNVFLPEDSVLVISDDGLIKDIIQAKQAGSNQVETFQGIISPGFINAHCHLELSHLKNVIPQHTGIVDFGLSVIKNRNIISEDEQLEFMKEADLAMFQNGIVAVGDICNLGLSKSIKQLSSIYYHSFVELIALNPNRADDVFNKGLEIFSEFHDAGLPASLCPHAPYSVSSELIELITNYCYTHHVPSSIHNQESIAENHFFISKSGDYTRLYQTLQLDIDFFQASGQSSLESIIHYIHPEVNTILVHNTFSSRNDIELAQDLHSNLYWCFCPNANLYIENTLPNLSLFDNSNMKIVIGTDSLASNTNLNILEEINVLKTKFTDFPIEKLLSAATFEGAKALGVENKFGTIAKGMKPGLNVLSGLEGEMKVKRLA